MTKIIPEFESAADRERYMLNHADYFTVVRKVGLSYERHEEKTLEKAVTTAQTLANRIGKPYMIYAVVNQSDSWIKNVNPQP